MPVGLVPNNHSEISRQLSHVGVYVSTTRSRARQYNSGFQGAAQIQEIGRLGIIYDMATSQHNTASHFAPQVETRNDFAQLLP